MLLHQQTARRQRPCCSVCRAGRHTAASASHFRKPITLLPQNKHFNACIIQDVCSLHHKGNHWRATARCSHRGRSLFLKANTHTAREICPSLTLASDPGTPLGMLTVHPNASLAPLNRAVQRCSPRGEAWQLFCTLIIEVTSIAL